MRRYLAVCLCLTELVFSSRCQAAQTLPAYNILFRTARSFRYAADRRQDYWQSADETSQKHAGDCEDIAIWLYTKLKEAGYRDIELVVGRYRTIDSKLHMWVTYRDPKGEVYILDPVIQKKPWKAAFFGKGFYKTFCGAERMMSHGGML